nr:putative receptor-like protein kinase At4g00960 [Ipomoea batatas]
MDSLKWIAFQILRKMKGRKPKRYENSDSEEISFPEESVEYDFITIQNATNNFSETTKIGEGGFGVVYKVGVFSQAWTHWKGGSASNVIDPMLRGIKSPVDEITKCIHIALLCVQESVPDRPKMIEVLQMLNNLSIRLPEPLDPGRFICGSIISSEASSQFTKNVKSISDQYVRKMQKKAKSYSKTVDESSSSDEISPVGSNTIKYELITIQKATNNFSKANKLGQGGYGPVYKGKLENGLEVAVKRLSKRSTQDPFCSNLGNSASQVMDLQKWVASLSLSLIFLSLHLCSMAADIDPNYEYNECGKTGNYTQNSTYSDNLNTLLSSLSNNVDDYGFYNGSVGQGSDRASTIVLCRGDVELNICRGCVKDNAERIKQLFPNQREAFRWYNICSIYYSDESILGSLRTTPVTVQYSANTVQNPARFTQDLTTLVDRLRGQAVDGGGFLNCNDCLITAFTQWSGSEGNDRIGARVLCPSCFFRYEISPFFGNTLIKKPPSTPSPPPPDSGNDDGNKGPKVIVIVVSIVAGLLIVLAICIFIIIRRRKKRKDKNYGEIEGSSTIDEISVVESLQYDFTTIKNATDNFSEENKIGEGGLDTLETWISFKCDRSDVDRNIKPSA